MFSDTPTRFKPQISKAVLINQTEGRLADNLSTGEL